MENNISRDDAITQSFNSLTLKYQQMFRDDLSSSWAYIEMAEITRLIKEFFNGNFSVEGNIISRALSLPKKRLLHFYTDNMKKISDEYWKEIYHLTAYEAHMGRNELLENKEIRDMVYEKVRVELEKLKENLELPVELFSLVDKAKLGSPKSCLDIDLLGKIYEYNSGILKSSTSLEENKARNRISQIPSKLNYISKGIKGRTFALVPIVAVPLSIILSRKAMINDVEPRCISTGDYKTKVTIDNSDNGFYSLHSIGVDSYQRTIYDNIDQSYIGTQRRYISVFGDTNDGITNIKVYDYTDSNLSDDELNTITLDENRLFFNDDIDLKTFKNLDVSKNLKEKGIDENKEYYIEKIGIYTGKSHRNITKVAYAFDPHDVNADYITLSVLSTIFFGLIAGGVIGGIVEEKELRNKLTEELIENYDKLHAIELKKKLEEYQKSNKPYTGTGEEAKEVFTGIGMDKPLLEQNSNIPKHM